MNRRGFLLGSVAVAPLVLVLADLKSRVHYNGGIQYGYPVVWRQFDARANLWRDVGEFYG